MTMIIQVLYLFAQPNSSIVCAVNIQIVIQIACKY